MSPQDIDAFIDTILACQLGEITTWKAPETPPLLGSVYKAEVERASSFLQDFIATQRAILKVRDESDLLADYNKLGEVASQGEKEHWDKVRRNLAGGINPSHVVQAGLGNPLFFPDYAYWSRMETFTIQEVTWLCLGLNPKVDWKRHIGPDRTMGVSSSPQYQIAMDLQDQIARFIEQSRLSAYAMRPAPFYQWVLDTKLPVHPGFLEVLKATAERQTKPSAPEVPQAKTGGNDKKQPRKDNREIETASKIILAVAMDAYGYVPEKKRSPIPKEIEGHCDRLGLSVSQDTIRKYLDMGKKHLPKQA